MCRLVALFALALATMFASACGATELGNPTAPTPPSPPTFPVGTSWDQLPPLSDVAKRFITEYNLLVAYPRTNIGVVKRWNDFPIAVYADSGFRPQDLVAAVDLWRTSTNGKITFRIVSVADEASIVLNHEWPPDFQVSDTSCGVEGPSRFEGNVIVYGVGHYAFKAKPQCAGNEDHRIGLAHGIGHILGLGGHTTSGSDLMGSPRSTWNMSPLLSEIINWLYSVPPETRPQ